MPLRRFSPGLKAQFAFGMVFLFVQPDASAADISAQQIGGVIIPQAFSQALQDGMSVPLYIHRNTLVYRLDKLQKSTGLDLRVFEDAITFKIALMVVKYMKYMESIEY